MSERLENRVAAVTGASAGVGRPFANWPAAGRTSSSRHVAGTDSVAGDLEDEFGVEAVVAPTEVRDDDVEGTTTAEYRIMMETNVDGVFFTTRAAPPYLREGDGNLVFVGSFVGRYPGSHNPEYAALRWWNGGFALTARAVTGPKGVAVSLLNPSEVRTEFGAATGESFADRFEEGTVLEPEQVAEALAFAATRRSTVGELDRYRRGKLEFF